VSTIPENHEFKELHKTVILDTAHILRKLVMCKYEYIEASAGASYMGTVNSRDRIVATFIP
jgi:hypothetical protein